MITRRHLLAGSAVAIASAALAATTEPSIIDAHFHIWDRGQLEIPWLHTAGELLNRDYTPAHYQHAIAGLNVRGSVYVEVAVDPPQRVKEAGIASKLCNLKQPRVLAAVVGGDPTDPGFARYVDLLQARAAIHGMRVTLPSKPATNAAVLKGLRRLGKLHLTVDLNAGGSQLLEMVELLKACDETLFVIDHCGNASPSWFERAAERSNIDLWQKTIEKLAACPNVACKISGVAENGPAAKPESIHAVARFCLDAFGPDRVLFATNWPVCLKATTPAKWFSTVDQLTRQSPVTDRDKLFAQNAERWYRLAQ